MPGGEAAEEYHSKDFEWDQLRQEIEADPSLRYHLLPVHVNADDDGANSNGPSSSSQSLSGSSSSPSHDSEAWNNFHARHSSGKFFKVGAKDELSRVETLDNPPLDICPIKLDGSNYLLWSRMFTLAITAHGMSKFIEGPVPQPTAAGSELEAWTSQNALAMTWLFNSMKPTILHMFLFLDTPYKVWVAVAQIYSQKGNDAQAFELRKKLRGLDQHNRSLAEYYGELCGVWQELDYYHGFQAVCSADAATFQQRVGKERIYDFLAGLDMKYDLIRVQVLGRIPFPSLGEAYACVQQEESRQSAMAHLLTLDRSALVAIPTPWDGKPIQGQLGDKGGSIDRDLLWCDYCHKTKHTREFCWKLHGRPSRGRGGGPVRSHAHVSESTIDTLTTPSGVRLQAPEPDTSHAGTLSQGELQTLRRLMARLDTPSSTASTPITSSYFAHTSIHATASSSLPWIIDFGVIDDMTGCSSFFDSYSTCSGKDKTTCVGTPQQNGVAKCKKCHLAEERRYLLKEFPELLSCNDYSKVLEVGCGNGSTVLPILRGKESITVYSCDCCHEALERAQEMIDATDLVNVKQRFHLFLCDFSISGFPKWLACEHCREFILQNKDILLPDVKDKIVVAGLNGFSSMKERSCCLGGVDFVTLIFTLSAVPLHRMPAAIAACFSVLKPGGLLLFRDYGLYDMTMLRFEPDKKVGFREYIRSDGTRSYFFSLDTVRDLFVHAGFNELELEYCCVKSVNRRKGKSMQRVWVHGKFQKSM